MAAVFKHFPAAASFLLRIPSTTPSECCHVEGRANAIISFVTVFRDSDTTALQSPRNKQLRAYILQKSRSDAVQAPHPESGLLCWLSCGFTPGWWTAPAAGGSLPLSGSWFPGKTLDHHLLLAEKFVHQQCPGRLPGRFSTITANLPALPDSSGTWNRQLKRTSGSGSPRRTITSPLPAISAQLIGPRRNRLIRAGRIRNQRGSTKALRCADTQEQPIARRMAGR